METWGRSIPDTFDLCKDNGLPKRESEIANGHVFLTVHFKQPHTPYLSSGVNDGMNVLGENIKQAYNFIQGNPGIKASQLNTP